jgi:hypothetical protein
MLPEISVALSVVRVASLSSSFSFVFPFLAMLSRAFAASYAMMKVSDNNI